MMTILSFLSVASSLYGDILKLKAGRYRDDYRDRDYRRRSRSRSWDRYDRYRYRGRDEGYRRRGRSRSASPDYYRDQGRGRYDDERRSWSRSIDSASPVQRSPSPRRNPPHKNLSPRDESPDKSGSDGRSLTPQSVSPQGRSAASQSPSP